MKEIDLNQEKDLEKSFVEFYQSDEFKITKKILNLQSNSLILDYGSGRYLASLIFTKDKHKCIPFEINISDKVGLGILNHSLFKNTNIQGILGDGEILPYKNNIFDVIHCRESLSQTF